MHIRKDSTIVDAISDGEYDSFTFPQFLDDSQQGIEGFQVQDLID
jgi:hypothetical protein